MEVGASIRVREREREKHKASTCSSDTSMRLVQLTQGLGLLINIMYIRISISISISDFSKNHFTVGSPRGKNRCASLSIMQLKNKFMCDCECDAYMT